jgi:hypothetical protein
MTLVTVAFLTAMGILAVSVSGKAPLIRIKFFPDNYTVYYVELQGPVATPIERTRDLLKEISGFIAEKGPGVAKSATAYAGFVVTEDYEQVFGSNLGNVVVEMPARADQQIRDPEEYLESMRRELAAITPEGWRMRVRAEKDGPPAGKDVTIRIIGTDHGTVEDLSREMLGFLRSDPGVAPHLVNLEDDRGVQNRILRFRPDIRKTAEHDLSPEDVAKLAASVLDGRFVGKYRMTDEEIDIRLKVDPAVIADPLDALAIPLIERDTGPLRLSDLAAASVVMEPGQLNRFQGQRAVTLTANIQAGHAGERRGHRSEGFGLLRHDSRAFSRSRTRFFRGVRVHQEIVRLAGRRVRHRGAGHLPDPGHPVRILHPAGDHPLFSGFRPDRRDFRDILHPDSVHSEQLRGHCRRYRRGGQQLAGPARFHQQAVCLWAIENRGHQARGAGQAQAHPADNADHHARPAAHGRGHPELFPGLGDHGHDLCDGPLHGNRAEPLSRAGPVGYPDRRRRVEVAAEEGRGGPGNVMSGTALRHGRKGDIPRQFCCPLRYEKEESR